MSTAVLDSDVLNNLNTELSIPADDRAGYSKIAVGIDWGTHENHIVIMGVNQYNETEIIKMIVVPVDNNYKNIDSDINKTILEISPYEPDIILADLGYNGTKVNRLIQEFGKDKVFGVKVNPSKASGEIKPSYNSASNVVTIDKLSGNLFTISQLKSGNIKFDYPAEDPMIARLILHWKNVVIRDVDDDDGNIFKEITRKGPDHLAQAQVYAMYGMRHLIDTETTSNAFDYSNINLGNFEF